MYCARARHMCVCAHAHADRRDGCTCDARCSVFVRCTVSCTTMRVQACILTYVYNTHLRARARILYQHIAHALTNIIHTHACQSFFSSFTLSPSFLFSATLGVLRSSASASASTGLPRKEEGRRIKDKGWEDRERLRQSNTAPRWIAMLRDALVYSRVLS